MPISISDFRGKIISKIKEKLEIRESMGAHVFYHLSYKGMKIGKTWHSHGSGGKEIPDGILSKIKNQLKLNSVQQIYDLKNCPMTAEDYLSLLKNKNVISN